MLTRKFLSSWILTSCQKHRASSGRAAHLNVFCSGSKHKPPNHKLKKNPAGSQFWTRHTEQKHNQAKMVNKHVSVFYIAFTCNCEQPFQASSSQHTRYKIKTHTHTIYIVFCLLLYFTSCKCFEQHQYLVTTNWGTNLILPVHSGTGISHTTYRKEKSMESI